MAHQPAAAQPQRHLTGQQHLIGADRTQQPPRQEEIHGGFGRFPSDGPVGALHGARRRPPDQPIEHGAPRLADRPEGLVDRGRSKRGGGYRREPARVLAEGRARGLGQVHGAAPRQTQLSQPIKGPVHGGDIVRQAHCCGQLLVVHRIAATLPGGNRLRHQQVPGVEAVKGPQGGRAGRKAFDQLGQVERAGLRQIGPGTQQDSQLLGVEGPDRVGKRTRRGAHREAPPDGASG
ncbi:hypothetical protein [Propionibacterium freudenreichii]|uniref:hypothetical protein n=1 Tax=Propionibacterium freudenreichii TaxID=1744 RepID=UPI00254EED38|nr:hypothetical protein [Propionibacterium freudenreichii]MDK9301633.1 hypothetical protein [Propionibacterium freudenreichii]MDK9340100.1 hypothetical protein [Propionibacterium freudenreichii]MDK9648480.1 hypothetical protein [Propionibacterium freudenreichii]